jgi:hypothetical protein
VSLRPYLALPLLASATTDWLSAIGTLALGVIGALFTFRQWWVSGFQLKCRAEIEPARDAIRVRIHNVGRASGVVNRVVVVHSDLTGVSWAQTEPFRCEQVRLPGLDQIQLIIQAPPTEKFDLSYKVLVEWGGKRSVAKLQPVDVGLFGLPSLIPPQ